MDGVLHVLTLIWLACVLAVVVGALLSALWQAEP